MRLMVGLAGGTGNQWLRVVGEGGLACQALDYRGSPGTHTRATLLVHSRSFNTKPTTSRHCLLTWNSSLFDMHSTSTNQTCPTRWANMLHRIGKNYTTSVIGGMRLLPHTVLYMQAPPERGHSHNHSIDSSRGFQRPQYTDSLLLASPRPKTPPRADLWGRTHWKPNDSPPALLRIANSNADRWSWK